MVKLDLSYKISWFLVLIALSLTIFVVYFATSSGPTPYDYFTRLAGSFLQGKYYLTDNPGWLNELVKIGENKYAVVYPPAPAIVVIPFVFIFKTNFQQQLLSQMMGAFASLVWGLIAYKLSKRKMISLWVFLLSALGNIVWFLSANGSVWYLGQVSAFLFLTLTIYESVSRKRVFLVAFYFGMAILSRLQIVLAFPLIAYLNWEEIKHAKRIASFILGLSFFGIIYGTYNFLRFGSFLQTGYTLIPGVLQEPWYQNGLFNLKNIPNHLRVMFTSLPIFINNFPYIKPSWGGLSIWATTPAFIYSFWVNFKDKTIWFSWFSILLISILIFSHGTTGFTQFGYRFAVDFYPLLLFLVTKSVSRSGLKWHHWFLLALSILVNLWGVVWIKLGWVSF